MKISVFGVDLGKKVWSIVGLNASGAVALRRRAKRETPIGLAARLSPCIVATEACRGAHRLGRIFAARGHRVRLLSPEYVRPYVKAQKNDDRDAEARLLRERFSPEGREEPKVRSCEHRETGEAIAEAATRPTMRFVALKSQERLDMRTLHRSRDRLVGERTALINRLRAILLERGIVVAKGKRRLGKAPCRLAGRRGGEKPEPADAHVRRGHSRPMARSG